MASSRRSCRNHPNIFCYICGEYTLEKNRKPVTDFVTRVYLGYFGVKLADQDKIWAPHIVCKTCTEHLRQWTSGNRSGLKFGIPMVWREPRNHHDDCYFCLVNIIGINRNNRSKWTYPDLDSARRPYPHSDEVPIPTFSCLPELPENEDLSHMSDDIQDNRSEESDSDFAGPSSTAQNFNQHELNDLIRDLNLSKESSKLLASRLKEKNLLDSETKITFYRNREKNLLPFFSENDQLVFSHHVGYPHDG